MAEGTGESVDMELGESGTFSLYALNAERTGRIVDLGRADILGVAAPDRDLVWSSEAISEVGE